MPPRSNAVPEASDITPSMGIVSGAPRTSAPPSTTNAGRLAATAADRSIGCVSVTVPKPILYTFPFDGIAHENVTLECVFRTNSWRGRLKPVNSAFPQLKCWPLPTWTRIGNAPFDW